ncbi:MAG: helical backbone metal receptor [Thermoanaerobaculia bacterium]|nr:helical backbone metal receptor [Thermoanaerobaculia bacterium]
MAPPLALLCLGLVLSGVVGGQARAWATGTAIPGPQPQVAASEAPTSVTSPRRIVALAPNVVELLFALGLGDRVVGVGDYCHWPPEVATLPHLGGLGTAQLESIVALEPDLVVALRSEGSLALDMRRLGVAVLSLGIETLGDIEAAALAIGDATQSAARAEAFSTEFSRHMVQRRPDHSPSVAVVFGRQPGDLGRLMTAGPSTYIDEILSLLGSTNAFGDVIGRYPQISVEDILRRDPDVILEIQWEEASTALDVALRQDWHAFPSLKAVREQRIGVVAGGYTVIPGPRLTQLYDAIAAALEGGKTEAPP